MCGSGLGGGRREATCYFICSSGTVLLPSASLEVFANLSRNESMFVSGWFLLFLLFFCFFSPL